MANTIVGLLDEAAARYSERTALVTRRGYRVERWSYTHLRARSEKVAAALQGCGVRPGDRVVLWGPNSPEWVTAFFGSLRAGAVVVPLDVRSTQDFVRKVIARTAPRLVLSSLPAGADRGGFGTPAVRLDEPDWIASAAGMPEPSAVKPHDIAEIMFTSGTTGEPKGVILTHANIVANVSAATQVVPIGPHDRALSLLPLSHMLEQTVGLLAPLSGGASVYYPEARQPAIVLRALKAQRITAMVLVPQALELFMRSIDARVRERGQERAWRLLHRVAPHMPMAARRSLFRPVHRQLGGSLRFILCGGAFLDPVLARKWEDLGIPIVQGYGATEAAPIIASNSLKRRNLDSVGRPLPGVGIKLASDGEVLVRGPNVTPGYWLDPAATSAAFDDGWYKTGDLAVLDAEGFLYFKGRKKDLIVLSSGLNVHPQDIEAVLKKHAAVADAAVVGLTTEGQDVQVHAALLLKPGETDARTIVEHANAELAEHQRIHASTVWPEADFPRTHTLKIKKDEVVRRLIDLREARKPSATVVAAAAGGATALSRLVARVAQRPLEEVHPAATLGGDLGLDSLRRVELLAALETEMGVELDESHISGATTVRELETLCGQAGAGASKPSYPEWSLTWPARTARSALQDTVLMPALRLWCRPVVEGVENLSGIQGPVIFAANHTSHLDGPLALAALPRQLRRRTAVAAAADYFFRAPGIGSLVALLWNAFPFSRGGAVRTTLDRCGAMMDKGWSVLVFPEATRSTTGRMGQFKSGIGLMAVELRVPVVPIYIEGAGRALPKGASLPRRARVSVRIGRPLAFPSSTSYLQATGAVEAAVHALALRSGGLWEREAERLAGARR